MARRAAGRGFVRSARKGTDWSASLAQTGTVAVAAGSKTLLQTFTPVTGGETVIRTRGIFTIASDQSSANELQIGALGICVVSDIAAAAGVASIPGPATNAAWGGWMVHQYFARFYEVITAVGVAADFGTSFEVDSKAMRKVDENDRLVVVVENSASAHGIEIMESFRFLSKLH